MQPTPQQSANEPTITVKIQIVDEKIRECEAVNNLGLLSMLYEYRRHLEQQLQVFTDIGCIPKTHTDTGCIPPKV